MSDLLIEVGTEELPPTAAPIALLALAQAITHTLAEAHLAHGTTRTFGTPRRLAVIVSDVLDQQPTRREMLTGPPVSAGSRAVDGFARKHGVDSSCLVERDGRFVLDHELIGKPTLALLPDRLARAVRELPWPKPMHWGDVADSFARPVLWVVALFGGEVVPFEFAGVKSGRETRGHRVLAPGPFLLAHASDYEATLSAAHVIADVNVRRERIWAQLQLAATSAQRVVRSDARLLEEVTWLCEEPTVILGSFDARYLELPEAVIVSAMRNHQRYFSLEDASGKLVNQFATVAATQPQNPDVVQHGNERVLAARLADARFFFDEDRNVPLSQQTEKLQRVMFQAKLGTVYEKVERVAGLGIVIARKVGVSPEPVARAAQLAKADLVSRMIYEFPDLQGQMGAVYARLQGEPAEVVAAIVEHYLPRFADDALPKSPAGAVLAVADRLDTLVGCFGVELQPTGTADPYGLRRAAIGVIRILLARGWRLPLAGWLQLAAARYQGRYDSAIPQLAAFVRARFRGLAAEEVRGDLVDAVMASPGDDLVDLQARVFALADLRKRPDFEPLAKAFKRVANILKGEAWNGHPNESLMRDDAERQLWCQVRALLHSEVAGYAELLAQLAALKPAVDRFFDDVLVMDEDRALRENRLALLGTLNDVFRRIADFRQIAVA